MSQKPYKPSKPSLNPKRDLRAAVIHDRAHQSHYKDSEIKIHGLHACEAVFQKRPGDIVKLYLHKSKMKALAPLVQHCVKNRLAYKLVDDDELKRLAESVHHEGVCLIVKDKPSLTFAELLKRLKSRGNFAKMLLPFLDGVQNPHNVGNILRTAAHFGVEFLLLADSDFARLPPSARRVSEGGSEFVELVLLADPVQDLQTLRKLGFAVCTTSSHASESVWQKAFPGKTVLVMGGESLGVSAAIEKLADRRVLIPGTGRVESLNVASALAVLVSQYFKG